MYKRLLIILACFSVLCLRTACGCRPAAQKARQALFTPGSIKFTIIRK